MSEEDDTDKQREVFTKYLERIAKDAEKTENQDQKLTDTISEVSRLRDRINAIELLFEQVGKQEELRTELILLTKDIRGEAENFKQIRFWMLGVSFAVLATLIVCLLSFVTSPQLFEFIEEGFRFPLITAFVGACVLIILALLKGTFKTTSDTLMPNLMKEQIGKLYELYGKQSPAGDK